MNIQASYNIRITQNEDFIFILGDEERILVQVDLTHDLIKTRCVEVIHFELNDTSIFAYHLDYNLVELPIIDSSDQPGGHKKVWGRLHGDKDYNFKLSPDGMYLYSYIYQDVENVPNLIH